MGCLHGVGIVFANVAPHNVQDLTNAASALGATVFTPFEASQATHLIANNVLRLPDGSDPYLTSIQAKPDLVVVSVEWLSTCHAEQRQVSTGPYALGPFSGVKVSITNFGAKERDMVVLQLKQGCANYSPELFRHTTHLVGNRAGGNKYTHAREWGLFIVHHDWVLDCLKAGHRLDERPYNLETYAPKDTSVGPLASSGDHQRQPSSVVAPGPTDSVCGGAPAVNASAALARGVGGSALRPANGLVPPGAEDAFGAAKGHPARGARGAAPSFSGQPQPQTHVEQYYHIPAVPPDDCYFLHWVRLWVVGCTSSEQSHVLAALRESGATREPVLHGGVTHIVFGSVLSTADLAEVRAHLAEHREQVKLARLSWLYECVNRRSYMEPEGPYAMTVAQLLLAQGGGGTGQLLPAQSGRLGQRSREGSPALAAGGAGALAGAASAGPSIVAGRPVAPLDDYVPLDPEANNRTMDSISVRNAAPGVFSGLWFTLVAVGGTEEEPTATKLVRQGGGMIMSATTDKTVREPHRRYAVCPFSLPQATVDRLCSSRGRERGQSEFERVPPEQRVTVAWLRACIARGELLPAKRETPLFRPLPHALPLPRFQGLTLAVSQYHVEQREVLQQLISGLGGIYTEKLNKRCDYLVIHEAQGDKFAAALRWGVPCVRADWVLESAYAGGPLDDKIFAFLPVGITPAEMEERRAAASRARGRDGCGPSQLGPTQRPLPLQVSQLPATLPVRSQQGGTQCHADGRTAGAPSGLPPRPSQAPDRHGAPTQALLGMPAPAHFSAFANPGPPLPMAPPPAPSFGAAAGPSREASGAASAPAAAAPRRPPSLLKPVISAILADDDDMGETEEGATGIPIPSTRAAAEVSQGQLSGNLAGPAACLPQAAQHAAPVAPGDGGAAGSSAPAGAGLGRREGPHGATSSFVSTAGAAAAVGPTVAELPKPPLPPPPQRQQELEPPAAARQRQAEEAARELGGAAASLMQFIDTARNSVVLPDMACSQLDLPMQLPIPGVSEGPLTGAGASSMSSREAGSSAGLSLKTADGDGCVGGISGRRSRKRTAAASVGEVQGMPGKVGGLPGRRSRNDDEEEGFGVAMSQQVGYEAVAAAPPPRATRSSTRGGRGTGGTDAKENLIKAVQGSIR
ncbi:hypothetical protein PLESTB_001466100 [Pleodorina starrii]|uniref:BRCT domain-containing protein n=1 Tax=Pleodorina starrii TaxID=330485 RepID=A0A9W6F7E5_9CHLO|nr:hypothetical protein PLESTB_001466100 [Pleodorina starrii]